MVEIIAVAAGRPHSAIPPATERRAAFRVAATDMVYRSTIIVVKHYYSAFFRLLKLVLTSNQIARSRGRTPAADGVLLVLVERGVICIRDCVMPAGRARWQLSLCGIILTLLKGSKPVHVFYPFFEN